MSGAGRSREREAELSVLYRFHGVLTDNKLLEKIAPKEERQLEKIRSILIIMGKRIPISIKIK